MRPSLVTAATVLCVAVLAAPYGAAAEPSGGSPAATSITGPPIDDTPTDGADPGSAVISQQKYNTVFEPAPGHMASTPFADAFDADGNPTRKILLSWQENDDVATVNSVRAEESSTDRGYTFPSGQTDGMAGFYTKHPLTGVRPAVPRS